MPERRWAAAWALVPVAAALLLSLWSISFGLPFLFRPDEDVLVARAVRMAAEHTADPLFFYYPPFAFQVFAAAERLVSLFGAGNLAGAAGPDPTAAILTARVTSALAFAAIAGFTALSARRLFGTPAGIVAGLVVALAPLTVREGHFATTDSIEVALVAAVIWAGLRAAGPSGFLLAGLLAGLGAATKYHYGGLVFLVPLVMALQVRDRRSNLIALFGGSAVGFAAPFVATGRLPGPWLDGLRYDSARVAGGYGLPVGWVYHPLVSIPFGLGLGAALLALAGLVAAAFRRRPADIALLAYIGVYFLVVGASHQVFFRYMMPIYPALAILAGGLVTEIPARFPRWSWALLLVLLIPSLYASVENDRLLGAVDTRRQAADWLLANAPAGSSIWYAGQNYWGVIFYDRGRIEARMTDPVYHQPDPLAGSFLQGRFTTRFVIDSGTPDYTVLESGPPWQAPVPATSKPVLAVFPAYSGRAPSGVVYDPIDSFWLPYWGFGSIDHPGPSIVIVKGAA